ncbi:iron-containing alcohol dehydrogenase family protein [Halomarina pelagica]|uniref:iron-containing alcohol dehydrogenase family protein n=1 Tax=Halomarina pelagica TaxID=2961599 RepID=UPI0020C54494|nr:iron-containing alcohol dehydrogenase family protein [Halomarina sp. BND7]
MTADITPFVFDYEPGAIHFGRGCVADLDDALGRLGADRALVVAGRTVGTTESVVGPVRDGLGDRLAGVFAETTPEKRIETAVEGVEAMRERDADALVALGGGSSLDVATAIRALAGRDLTLGAALDEIEEVGYLRVPERDAMPPCAVVPTTLAGADLSPVAGMSVPSGGEASGEAGEASKADGADEAGGKARAGTGISGRALMPDALFYDPDLFETTPRGVLAGSAMNGFDKGIEAIYSRNATPITDGTAIRGLSLLADALPRLDEAADDPAVMEAAVAGVVCCQYGVSVPGASKLSIVHAYGHGLRRRAGVQQGVAHAVMVPHVLRDLFEAVDGRRDLLAAAFDADDGTGAERAEGIVAAVERVRDGLDLPNRLRDLDGVEREDLPAIARLTHDDPLLPNGPPGYDPSVDDVTATLEAAW